MNMERVPGEEKKWFQMNAIKAEPSLERSLFSEEK